VSPNHCMQPPPQTVIKLACANLPPVWVAADAGCQTTSQMASATIKLFLVHGDPKRLRTAELSNWNGKAVSGPRTEFEGVLAREES